MVTVDADGVTSSPVSQALYVPPFVTRAVSAFATGDGQMHAVATEGSAVYVGGNLLFGDGNARAFGDATVPTTTESEDEGVVARLDASGSVVWARKIVGSSPGARASRAADRSAPSPAMRMRPTSSRPGTSRLSGTTWRSLSGRRRAPRSCS